MWHYKGLASLLRCCTERSHKQLQQYLESGPDTINVHDRCRNDYVRNRKSFALLDDAGESSGCSVPAKKLRSFSKKVLMLGIYFWGVSYCLQLTSWPWKCGFWQQYCLSWIPRCTVMASAMHSAAILFLATFCYVPFTFRHSVMSRLPHSRHCLVGGRKGIRPEKPSSRVPLIRDKNVYTPVIRYITRVDGKKRRLVSLFTFRGVSNSLQWISWPWKCGIRQQYFLSWTPRCIVMASVMHMAAILFLAIFWYVPFTFWGASYRLQWISWLWKCGIWEQYCLSWKPRCIIIMASAMHLAAILFLATFWYVSFTFWGVSYCLQWIPWPWECGVWLQYCLCWTPHC